MKKTIIYLSMAALAMVGVVITGCSNDDDVIDNPQQPENKVETLTATVTIDGEGDTRALDIDALNKKVVKTFAEGDKIAVVYKNTSGTTVKAESVELAASDITNEGKSANFTVTLEDADKTKNVTYIYPAAMAKSDGSANYSALATQDGTLDNIASNYDYCEYSGAWNAEQLPTGAMTNQLAICAFTLKDALGANEITSSVTKITVSDGTNTYTVTRSAAAGPIYVAIRPTSSKNINYTATDGTKFYAKYVTSKTYAAGKMYQLGLKMAEVISGKFTVNASGDKVYFSKGNLQATTTDLGANWTWGFAEHQWDKIGGRSNGGSETQTGNNYVTGTSAPTVSENCTVDLFGWSTSATYLGISNYNSNDNYSGAFVDWGSHADVTKTIGTGWRTMSNTKSGGSTGEWEYLLTIRSTASGMRFYKAQVNGVNGLILFPDDWNDSYHPLTAGNVNNNAISFESTKLTASDWNNDFESHGAVFLPVAGQRRTDNHYVDYPNGRGFYWSSTPNDAGTAYRFYFSGSSTEWSYSVGSSRRFGYSVRLVYDIK